MRRRSSLGGRNPTSLSRLMLWIGFLCFAGGVLVVEACDFASVRDMERRVLQDDTTPSPTSNETETTTTTEDDSTGLVEVPLDPSPTATLPGCIIASSSAVQNLQVDLKMLRYQTRGRLTVRNNCQFELRRFEIVVPTTESSGTQLTWYTSKSLEVEDVQNKSFLMEFEVEDEEDSSSNTTISFVGEDIFEFTIDAQVAGYDLDSVGAFLLVATTQDGIETLVATALIQKLVPGPAADLLADQPTMMENCWTVGEDVRLRWTVNYDETTPTIDWGLEYVAWIPTNTWMGVGPAFPGLENRLMGGSDVLIGGILQQGEEEDGATANIAFVDDFYIGGYEVCTVLEDGTYDGVCRDSTYTGNEQDKDAELIYSQSMEGVTFLRVRRPLQGTTLDYDHDLTPGIPQNLLWARGPLSPTRGIDDVQFHGYRYGELKGINLNETIWQCPPLAGIDLEGEAGDGSLEDDDTVDQTDPAADAFAQQFEQSARLPGNHMEVFWTLLPDTSQIYIGARANARSSSQWMSIAIGESMTDSWAWVASFDEEDPQLLTYRMTGLAESTVRKTSAADRSAMMVDGSTAVQREGGRLSFETVASWPLQGMTAGSTAAPIIYAIGPSWSADGSTPVQQNEHSIRSAAPTTIDFTTGSTRIGDEPQNILLLLHGVSMWLAWLVLAPLTTIASRYFRDDPCVSGTTPSWIQLHKYGALSVITLSLLGLILAILAAQDTGLGHFVSSHAKLGLVLVVMIFLQNGFGMVRPPADNPPVPLKFSLKAFTKRRIWSWSHRSFAVTMLILGIAAVITGSQRLESFDTRTRHGIALSFAWLVMVALLVMFYEHRRHELAKVKIQKEVDAKEMAALNEASSSDEEARPPADAKVPEPSSWEGTFLSIYGLPAAIAVGALVAFAAITFSSSMSSKPIDTGMTIDQVQADESGTTAEDPMLEADISAPTDCLAYPPSHLGDGWCDDFEPFNTGACGFDGGDCCNTTSSIYNCKDPSSPNFGASSPRGWGGIIPRNPRYTVSREESLESFVVTYNNYYEFGTSKSISEEANKHADFLEADGWFIDISGLVENPMTLNVEALIGQVQLEERMYRHRCVEAWSITSPWIGFPLSKLLDMVRPLPEAGIVRFVSWQDSKHSSTQLTTSYPWPYTEALTMEEARNELTMLTVGNFQKPLTPSQGAPIRLTVPWKFGYKSIKSIEQISFIPDDGPGSDSRRTFWSETISSEYGFWSNINPEVPHRRWSQATERHYISGFPGTRLDTTRMNGYQDLVDYLYEDSIDDPEIYF